MIQSVDSNWINNMIRSLEPIARITLSFDVNRRLSEQTCNIDACKEWCRENCGEQFLFIMEPQKEYQKRITYNGEHQHLWIYFDAASDAIAFRLAEPWNKEHMKVVS